MLSCIALADDKKKVSILRIDEKVAIDGKLEEAFWSKTPISTNFIQNSPITGSPASQKTEVRIAYDNSAIYVSAVMYDTRDSMSLTLSQRDNRGNADWFGVVFDPYNAGTIGFAFIVTSAGVQIDELHQVNGVDGNWNAVWKSAVTVHEDRWVAELKIPFSAVRFSKDGSENWGINFARNIRRHREQSHWNFFDPTGINLISQLGELEGLKDIESPLRLAFTPYVSGYIENYNGNTSYTANGGLDVKWGVNEAFTIDMTLVPDFGQVQFDNQVLNTSPFEVFFNERRQFFTEGTELFNKAGLFYSRRVGGRPINLNAAYADLDSNETVKLNPITTQLFNATKFSGRTKKGTGIGIFNAITAETFATIENSATGESRFYRTAPLSNYNVFVVDQNLKNNSSITLTNTNVWRSGTTYDANVTSLLSQLFTKNQKYSLNSEFVLSQIYSDSVELGHSFWAGFAKSAGNLQYGFDYSEQSSTYNFNDLGFQTTDNLRTFIGRIGYNWYKPFGRFYRAWANVSGMHQRQRSPDAYAQNFANISYGGTFKNFMTTGGNIYIEPTRRHNYFEPRVDGRFYEGDALVSPSFFMSSDYSKPFSFDGRGGWFQYFEESRYGFDLSLKPRIRFNDKWFLIYEYAQNNSWNEEGVALTQTFQVPFDPLYPEDPIFAKRDRVTLTNTVDLSYIFNNKMGVTFRLRHYWSKLQYNEFFRLNQDGKLVPTSYTGLDINDESIHDNAFNAFTIDMAYRWIFAPGSELSLVWKNSIFSFTDEVQSNYFQNLGGLFDFPATNSISLKVLYYFDYWALHQRLFKREKLKE
jgi:Domain of unknown function (DUF5916)/Carbohydrate family 9 binding domain-like